MVSIIITVINESSSIVSVLEGLHCLKGCYETIVVDGGSEDDTVALASMYAEVILSPRGRAVQMNSGARSARGEALLFLHADTRLPADALSWVEEALREPDVIGGRFKVKLDLPGPAYRIIEASINIRDRLIGGFTGDQGIFVRAGAFRDMGGYREIPLMEDLDFGRRMARKGKVARLPVAVTTSARRWQQDGVVRTVLRMWLLRYSYFLGVSPATLSRFYANTR